MDRTAILDRVGRALYEEPGYLREWSSLSNDRRKPWIQDAARVIDALKEVSEQFQEWSIENSGADWLCLSPRELWIDFLSSITDTSK